MLLFFYSHKSACTLYVQNTITLLHTQNIHEKFQGNHNKIIPQH